MHHLVDLALTTGVLARLRVELDVGRLRLLLLHVLLVRHRGDEVGCLRAIVDFVREHCAVTTLDVLQIDGDVLG